MQGVADRDLRRDFAGIAVQCTTVAQRPGQDIAGSQRAPYDRSDPRRCCSWSCHRGCAPPARSPGGLNGVADDDIAPQVGILRRRRDAIEAQPGRDHHRRSSPGQSPWSSPWSSPSSGPGPASGPGPVPPRAAPPPTRGQSRALHRRPQQVLFAVGRHRAIEQRGRAAPPVTWKCPGASRTASHPSRALGCSAAAPLDVAQRRVEVLPPSCRRSP